MTDTRQVLEEAWDTIARANGLAWATAHAGKFTRFLDAEAWTDAALMLVPEGWDSISIRRTDDGLWHAQLAGNDMHLMAEDPDEFFVDIEDCAEQWDAITQAALRAQEAGEP